MKAKINYKSKKTIIIAIIALALIIISGIAIGMFIKANDSSEAVGGNNTISDNNDSNANKNEASQNQTGELNGETAGNAGEGANQTNPADQENANNANNQGNNAGNANNNGANVPETEYIVGRTEIIPERVISENYYVSWVPTQFDTTIKGNLNKSNITAIKTVAKVTANGLIQNPQSVKVGEILQYTITLTNSHEKINGVVTVTDIIPEGTEFVSATKEKLTTIPEQYEETAKVTTLTWKNVKVEANKTVNLVVYVKVLKTVEDEVITSVQNKATITEGTITEEIESPETKVANITSQKTSKVIYNEQKPHEHIVVDGIEPLHEQDIMEYTITLINSGEAAGTVKVTDTVPEGTTLVPNSKVTVIDPNGVSTYEMSELVEGIDVTVDSAIEGEEDTARILGTATVTFKVIVNTFAEETKTIKNDMAKVDGDSTNTTEDEAEKVYIDIKATKEWKNIENDAAKQYAVQDILLVLSANGKEIEEKQANTENNWTVDFGKQPKYENNEEIIYTVAEKALDEEKEKILDEHYNAETSVEKEITSIKTTITNTFDLSTLTDTVDVPAKKVWENMESDAAKVYTVESIKLQVLGNNEFVKEEVVTAKENWECVFKDLPKYDANGNEITYTVAEAAVNKDDEAKLEKYTQNIDQETGTITNTFDPSTLTDTVDVPSKKAWENMESDAAKVYTVESIKLQVLGNNEFVKEEVVTAKENWECLFKDLPKYDANGNEITFTVAEAAVNKDDEAKLEKYTQNIDQETRTITNTFDPSKVTDTTEIKAEKVWEDNGSAAAEAYKMSSIKFEVRVYAEDGIYTVVQSKEVKADANGEWKVTFEDLAKYDENGNEIVYVIDEVVADSKEQYKLDAYEQEKATAQDGTKVIINTFNPNKVTDTIDIKAQKIWLNNGSEAAEAYKMSSIKFEVRVYAEDGTYTVVQSKEVKADANGEWKVTFEDLAKYDENGNEIVYVIDEVVADSKDQYKLDAYEQEKATAKDGTKVIINTFNPKKLTDTIDIKAEKVWEDNGSAAAEAYKMQSITFEARIYAEDGKYTVAQSKEVKADANGEWKVTFEDLAKYDANGNEIVYVIDEVVTNPEDQAKLDVYNKEISTAEDGTKVITNTFDPSKVTDTTAVKAEKVWKDNGSAAAEAYKMESITFEARIYAEDGKYIVAQSKEVKADENGEWKVTFEDLAKYDANGNEIVYVIDEVVTNPEDQAKLDVYNKEISTAEDGTKVITNTFDPSKVTDTTAVKAEKVWKDNGSAAAEAYKMQSITFEARIYAEEGTYIVVQSKEVKADANGEWKVTFEDLAKYDANGNEIVYVIDEVVTNPEDQSKLDVYNKEISTSEEGTKVITNTFDPSKVTDVAEVTITKIWQDNSNQYNTRPDSVTIKLSNGTNYVLTGAENAESWTKTISLPKYDNQGNLIAYAVTEENVPAGYTKVSEEGTTVVNRANAIVEKSAYKSNEDGTIGNEVSSSDEFKANDTVYYKLTFKNAGNSVIETKTLTDTLSLRLELVSINGIAITEGTVNGSDDDGYTWQSTASKNVDGTVINWTLTNVPAGAQKELIIKAKVSEEAEYKDLCQKAEGETDYTATLFVKNGENYTNSLGTVYLNSIDLSNILETLPSNDLYYLLKNNNEIVDMVSEGISRKELKEALKTNGITLATDEVVVWYAIKNENNEYHIYGEVRKIASLTVINNEVYMDNVKQDDVTIDLEDIEIGQSGTVTVKGVSTTTETVSTPMDVVFILDTSGSMDNKLSGQTTRKAQSMVNAVNTTIATIMSKNLNSRIGVVGYSDSASTIIPFGNYSTHEGNYLSLNTSGYYRYIQSNVSNEEYRWIDGGTNTQSGIKLGAEMLTNANLDRTFTTTVNGVEFTGTRTPVIILVTDGEPTYYYGNETATGTRNGSGSGSNENYYYWTLRTASYYKGQVKNAYYGAEATQQAKMFTIGIGLDGELATTMLNPTQTNVDNLRVETGRDGREYEVADGEEEKELYDLLVATGTPYAYNYADASTLGALTESEIQTFLNSSLSASSESFNVRNITVEESKERRIDLTKIDQSKEFLLTITPEEGEKIELNSLEEAKTTNNGEYGAYVKVDSTTGGLYVDLTGIDRTSTVNVTYWEQQTETK